MHRMTERQRKRGGFTNALWRLDERDKALAAARKRHTDGFAETRAQLDDLAQKAEGSHRQHMEGSDG